MNTDSFALRHIGPRKSDLQGMLKTVGVETMEQLIYETIPDNIRLKKPLNLDSAISEHEFAAHITTLSDQNKVFRSYLDLGYRQAITTRVIQRNIL